MKISRTFTYKLIPSLSQNNQLKDILQSTTFCYNLYLFYDKRFFEKSNRHIDLKQMLGQLKSFYTIHRQLNSKYEIYYNSTIVDFSFFIKKISSIEAFPEFKKESRTIVLLRNFQLDENSSTIDVPVLGQIKYINSRKIQGNIKALHLVYKFEEWYLDIVLENNNSPAKKNNALKFVGIDVGLNDFAILSNGKKVPNPRFYRKMEDKLIKEQKSLSRKTRKSANWVKQLNKVRKVHKKIFNSRMNFLHELTTYLTLEFDVIGIEKLAVSEMKKNRRFSKSIQDASWGTFVKLLKYKAESQGKVIVEVGRYFPSTKRCSKCGHTEIIPIHLRTFKCSKCNFRIQRDYNAALNIEQKAVEYALSHNLSGNRG